MSYPPDPIEVRGGGSEPQAEGSPLAPLFAQLVTVLERAGRSDSTLGWDSPGGYCPCCEMPDDYHTDDCEIAVALAALSSIERHVQERERETRCEKCGTDDVLVRWHEKRPSNRQAACRDSMSVLDYGKRPELKSEHLHYHCRRCQFDWTGPVLAALPASYGGPDGPAGTPEPDAEFRITPGQAKTLDKAAMPGVSTAREKEEE